MGLMIFIEQLIDQILCQFEQEKSIIFNQKQDLVLVECTTAAKVESM